MHSTVLCATLLLRFQVTAAGKDIPAFRHATIDSKVGIGYGLAIADVDGDRKPDILLVDKDVVAWYRSPGWEKLILAEKLTQLDHVCIAARDLGGDGKAEVAAGAGWNPGDTVGSGSVHYLVAPADRAQKWQPVELHHEPTVHRMRWVRDAAGQWDLMVSPLHGRGNKNFEGEGIKLLVYKKPADPKSPWTTELADRDLHVTHNLEPVDWDQDPEQEVLLAAKEGVFLLDRVPGASDAPAAPAAPGKWTRTQLGGNAPGETAFKGSSEIRTGRLPGGKRFIATVEPFHGNKVVVYTPPAGTAGGGGGVPPLWKRTEIDDTLAEGHAVACADLAGVGSEQILAGWRRKDKDGKVGIRLYTPAGPEGLKWSRSLLDDDGMACEDIAVADLDQDGRPDVVAAGRDTHNLKVYWNEGVGK